MYRALSNLSTGKGLIESGRAFPARALAPVVIEKLLAAGKICEVNSPPILQISEIKDYTRRLKKVSINRVDAFVDADPSGLAEVMGLSVERVVALQEKMCRLLDAPGAGAKG